MLFSLPTSRQLFARLILLAALLGSIAQMPAAESTTPAEKQLPGRLFWRNGDSLQGMLTGAAGDELRWDSTFFQRPVQLQIPFLQSIEFDKPGEPRAEAPYRAQLASGDVVFGRITGLDEQFVTLTDPRHGELRLRRMEVLELRHLTDSQSSLPFLGPNGLRGWRTLEDTWSAEDWSVKPGGGLRTERWRAELYHALNLSNKLQVELKLNSSKMPEFALAFSDKFEEALRLETWDDELVITQGTRFEPVRKLSGGDQSLHLRIFWDREAGKASVFTGVGEALAEVAALNPVQGGKPGLYLRNKGLDLELAKLRVTEWDGRAPTRVDETKNRVLKMDGSVIYGKVTGFSEGNLVMEDGRQVPTDQIDTIHFLNDARAAEPTRNTEITFPDGTRVSGRLEDVSKGRARVRTGYSPDPVATDLSGAKAIRFYVQADTPGQTPDILQLDGRDMKGTIRGSDDPDAPIHWLPLGGRESVPLKADFDARIIRQNTRSVGNLDGDRLFLNSREIISCQVEKLDETHVHFQTSLGGLTKLPLDQVRALEFREGRLQLTGFSDRAWTESKEGENFVTHTNKTVELDGGMISHPSILRADEIRFDLKWEASSHGAMSLGLFAQEAPDSQPPLEISFSCWSNRLWVAGAEPGAANMSLGGDDISITNGRAKVRVGLDGEDVKVWINEQQLLSIRFDEEKRLGNGLRFASGSPWFERINDLGKTTVSNFEVRSTTGLLAPLRVDKEAKMHALTIPRFRRDTPDTHILIAPTGDLLRGRLTGIVGDEIQFTSRLEELTFPRERVAGIVCLDVPDAAEKIQEEEARVILTDGTVIRLTPTKMTNTTLFGDSPSLGECQLPTASIRQIHLGKVAEINKQLVYADWERVAAVEPEIPKAGGHGGGDSDWVGKEAPTFELPLLTEGSFNLKEEQGKVVVLEFWATWCGPCVRAFPEYLQAMEGLDPEKVRFIGVNQAEPASLISRFLERHKWTFEVARDSQARVAGLYGVEGIPHTVVVDQQGKIAWVATGFRPGAGEEMKKAIEELLNNSSTAKGEVEKETDKEE